MAIGPINRIAASKTPDLATDNISAAERQIVAAIQGLNQAALLEQGRELAYRRDPRTGRLVIHLMEKDSGEVIDEIAPESVVDLLNELQQKQNPGESEW